MLTILWEKTKIRVSKKDKYLMPAGHSDSWREGQDIMYSLEVLQVSKARESSNASKSLTVSLMV